MRIKRVLLLIIAAALVFALTGCIKFNQAEEKATGKSVNEAFDEYAKYLKEKDFKNLEGFYSEYIQFISKSKGNPDYREEENPSKIIQYIKDDFGFEEGAKIKEHKIIEIKNGTSKDDKAISDRNDMKIVKVQYTVEDSNGKTYIIERDYWYYPDDQVIQGEVAYTH